VFGALPEGGCIRNFPPVFLLFFFGVIIKEIDLHFTMEFTADDFFVQEGGQHELLMTPPFSHSVESAV